MASTTNLFLILKPGHLFFPKTMFLSCPRSKWLLSKPQTVLTVFFSPFAFTWHCPSVQILYLLHATSALSTWSFRSSVLLQVSFFQAFKIIPSVVPHYCFPITPPYFSHLFYPFSNTKPNPGSLIDGVLSLSTQISVRASYFCTENRYCLQPTTVVLQPMLMTQLFLLRPYFVSSMYELSWSLHFLALEFPFEFPHLALNPHLVSFMESSIVIILPCLSYFLCIAPDIFPYLSFLLLQNT